MTKKKEIGDVRWILPGKKKPVAQSTMYASESIEALSENGRTIQDVYNEMHYGPEERGILQKYIEAGYGNKTASKLFAEPKGVNPMHCHDKDCAYRHPECLCLDCKNDNSQCCFEKNDKNFVCIDCKVVKCKNYSKEEK